MQCACSPTELSGKKLVYRIYKSSFQKIPPSENWTEKPSLQAMWVISSIYCMNFIETNLQERVWVAANYSLRYVQLFDL